MNTSFFDPSPNDRRWTEKSRSSRPSNILSFVEESTWSTWCGGDVIKVDDSAYQRDFVTGKVCFWPGTDVPKPTLAVTVMTDERFGPDDTGERRIFIPKADLYTGNGARKKEDSRYAALIRAMEASGMPGTLPQVGGKLWVRCDGPSGLNDVRKMWSMRYESPR